MTTLVGPPMSGARPRPGTDLIAAAELFLGLAREMDDTAADTRWRAVTGARSLGMTWDQIAHHLGMSPSGIRMAHERASARAHHRDA